MLCSCQPDSGISTPIQPETAEIIKERRKRLGWEKEVGTSPLDGWNSGELLRRALGRPVGDTVLIAWCIDRSLGERELQSAIVGEFTGSDITLYSIGRELKFGIVKQNWKLRFIHGPPNFLSQAVCPLPMSQSSFDWFIARCEWRASAGSDPEDECGELSPH